MFSLLSGIWQYLFAVPQFNVIVLGLDNAGKSTFLHQIQTICDKKMKEAQFIRIKTDHISRKAPQTSTSMNTNTNDSDINEKTKSRNINPSIKQRLYFIDPYLQSILPTMGQNIVHLSLDNMCFQFWDLPGQTSFRKIWFHYFTEVHAIIFIIDCADIQRLSTVKYELHKLLINPNLKYAPILVLANKQDLSSAVDQQTLIQILQMNDNCSDISTDNESESVSILRSNINRNHNILDFKQESDECIHVENGSLENVRDVNIFGNNRSMKVMQTCCLNKHGLLDGVNWLCSIVPKSHKRIQFVAKEYEKKIKQNSRLKNR